MKTYLEGVRDALSHIGGGRRSGSSFMSFVCGAGVGLMAGAAIAMLMTPTSGPEMRRELGTRAKKLADKTQGALSDAKQNMRARLGTDAEDFEHNEINRIPAG